MTPTNDSDEMMSALRSENTMLRDFIETSRDALWCIEFLEPVDLSAPESEVVRQVFENACVWRMCNPAMARLYRLPPNLDFNAENVRFVFPRNSDNEKFVRTLISANFRVDAVRSLDHDYDGSDIEMENDVRSHIADGHLTRMMGAVRNLNRDRTRDRKVSAKVDMLSAVLGALPDAVIVIDRTGTIQAANPAIELKSGWRIDEILGRRAEEILSIPNDLPIGDLQAIRYTLELRLRDGRSRPISSLITPYNNADNDGAWIVVLQTGDNS